MEEILKRLSLANPDPKIELDYVNGFTLAVAVILSAQSTDKGVNKATKALFEKVTTPQEMLELGEEGLKFYVKTIGLFNAKSANIIKFSKMLIEKYNGILPLEKQKLEEFPGIGRKSANVILTVLTDQETFPVDTHVIRIVARLGITTHKDPLKIEAVLERIVPKQYRKNAHHWLVLHGRYICKAIKPKCDECVLSDICPLFIAKNK